MDGGSIPPFSTKIEELTKNKPMGNNLIEKLVFAIMLISILIILEKGIHFSNHLDSISGFKQLIIETGKEISKE